jgi:hypothetical protein
VFYVTLLSCFRQVSIHIITAKKEKAPEALRGFERKEVIRACAVPLRGVVGGLASGKIAREPGAVKGVSEPPKSGENSWRYYLYPNPYIGSCQDYAMDSMKSAISRGIAD